jgi:hypothetical protein
LLFGRDPFLFEEALEDPFFGIVVGKGGERDIVIEEEFLRFDHGQFGFVGVGARGEGHKFLDFSKKRSVMLFGGIGIEVGGAASRKDLFSPSRSSAEVAKL